MKTFERRMAVTDLEVRESSDMLTLSGYASTFDQPYDMGWYREKVHPDAFKRTLGQSPDVRLLINHEGLPLARTTSGTLTLDTDSRGLRPMAQLDMSDPDVQRLAPKMKRGDLNQMSFAFRVMPDGDEWSKDMSSRTLRALDLNDGDVSIVTYPANPNAVAGLRSGDALPIDSIASAMRALEQRAASPENFASVLTRVLAYFSSIDLIVDNAQEELAEVLGIPNPDEDDSSMDGDDMPMRVAAMQAKVRALRLLA